MSDERTSDKPTGILGGGQLAMMLAEAGDKIGVQCHVYDPSPQCCAATLAKHSCAAWDDEQELARFAAATDPITFEFEHIPERTLDLLSGMAAHMNPGPHALKQAQDRRLEKRLLQNLGMDVAPWCELGGVGDLRRAAEQLGLPLIIKSARGGYDGKGQLRLADMEALERACADEDCAALLEHPAIAETQLDFERELSIIAARGRDGEMRFYDLAENIHHEGILRLSFNRPGDALQGTAEKWARALCEHLDYVGVLALECFVVDGALVANEFAPRVHNSGHWSIEATACSQFENHLRAVTGKRLGDSSSICSAAMINCISTLPEVEPQGAGVHYHRYGKAARPGRKLGHITACASDASALERLLEPLSPIYDSAMRNGHRESCSPQQRRATAYESGMRTGCTESLSGVADGRS